MKKTVAILTPSYNRAYTLGILFESLIKQSSYDFKWYIIDDGSTDDTKQKCESFVTDKFEIVYKYKENGGKHTCVNEGLDLIEEELTYVVDSDDFITPDAIESIVKDWSRYKNNDKICGLSYYKLRQDGSVIGQGYESEKEFVDSFINVRINKAIKGDKAEVVRTDLLKRFKFPVIEGDNYMTPGYQWREVSRAGYDMAFIPKGIYVCEYLADGKTSEGKRKVIKHPRVYVLQAEGFLQSDIRQKLQWKYILMYIAANFLAGNKISEAFRKCTRKFKFVCAFIPGWMLYKYWNKKWGSC